MAIVENLIESLSICLLEREAPAWYQDLKNSFESPHLELIKALYKLSGGRRKLEDPEVPRTAGSSFNPRPARICRILRTSWGQPNFEMCVAAILLCVPESEISPLVSVIDRDCYPRMKIFNTAKMICSGTFAAPLKNSSAAISISYFIDALWHMHQSKQSSGEKIERLFLARRLLQAAENGKLENDLDNPNSLAQLCLVLKTVLVRRELQCN